MALNLPTHIPKGRPMIWHTCEFHGEPHMHLFLLPHIPQTANSSDAIQIFRSFVDLTLVEAILRHLLSPHKKKRRACEVLS